MVVFLASGYHPLLVLLSIAIAGLASYTAVDLAGRVTATQGRTQVGWLISGAAAMGAGIWAMHFIGMLAFRLPVAVHYDFLKVLVSIVPAIVASGLALFLVSRPTLGGGRLALGSFWMGLGIASMHYLGMTAIETSAIVHYDWPRVALSVLIAMGVSWVGLSLVFQLREETASQRIWKKLLAATIMGAAIPTMHYTGMSAAHFAPMAQTRIAPSLSAPANSLTLTAAVSIGTLIILGLTLLTAYFDRRLNAQAIQAQALQASHQYLKTILQGIQVGVLVIEGDAELRMWNQAVLDLLHLPNEEALHHLWYRSRTCPRLIPNPAEVPLETILAKIATQQPVKNAIVEVLHPITQTATSLLVNAVPLETPNAGVTQTICTLSDVTDLKRAENRLKASETQLRQQTQTLEQTLQEVKRVQLQLVQSEKMSGLGQLVAGVAHEINNPVNFIHGNLVHLQGYSQDLLHLVDLYQQHYPQPVAAIQAAAEEMDLAFLQQDVANLLKSMRGGTDRIRQIVLSLRNFSRLDEAEFKTVDIHEGIESTLVILQHRLKAKSGHPGITVVRDYGELPSVECYPSILNQVFMNVLTNAIDAIEEASSGRSSPDRARQITIRTSVVKSGQVQIAIVDTGLGIPEAVQARIFDPFFTTKPVGQGTGMGMSISYQIVTEKHQGQIYCTSTLNQGTEFVIQLPIGQLPVTIAA